LTRSRARFALVVQRVVDEPTEELADTLMPPPRQLNQRVRSFRGQKEADLHDIARITHAIISSMRAY
jgi:hypothetical protein